MKYLLAIGALVGVGCAGPNYLGGNAGYRRPNPGASDEIRQQLTRFKPHIANEIEAEAQAGAATAILGDLFGDSFNPDLPDVLVYFDTQHEPRAPLLLARGHAVQILDREAVIWVVVLSEPEKGGVCDGIKVRLTTIAETRPDFALGINDLLASFLSRKAQDVSTSEPKEEQVEPSHLDSGLPTSLCWGRARFALPKDSYERVTVELEPPGASSKAKTTDVRMVNEEIAVRVDGLPAAIAQEPSPGHPPTAPQDAVPKAPQTTAPGPPTGAPGKRPEEPYPAAALFNFANARRPRYGASLGIGADLYNFTQKSSCLDSGGCIPTLYVFGHLWDFQLPYHPTWDPFPVVTIAPVLGVRLLNPVLGEAVAGVRIGLEDGLSRSLTRFGLVGGMGYGFRSFQQSATVQSSTTQTSSNGATSTTTTTTTVMSPSGNDWRVFTGFDFAF